MVVKVVHFRRSKESIYEKGLYIEESHLVISKKGLVVHEVYDMKDSITVIDFYPLLADTFEEFQTITKRDFAIIG